MASTYVNDLRLNEMATGDASGTWGDTTNTNLSLIGEALSFGTEGITTNADTHTTTVADGASDPGRAMYLKYTGTLDSACTITISAGSAGTFTLSKVWVIENATSGSQNIVITSGSGADVTIKAGQTKMLYTDGIHYPQWIQSSIVKKNDIKSISVHGGKDIRKSINIRANLVFISPVFETTSHKNEKSLGIIRLGLLVKLFKIPAIALGGINNDNISRLKSLPISGCAGIDAFLEN